MVDAQRTEPWDGPGGVRPVVVAARSRSRGPWALVLIGLALTMALAAAVIWAAGRFDHRVRMLSGRVDGLESEVRSLRSALPPDVPGLVADAEGAVVEVRVNGAVGTGFAIDADPPDGYTTAILTNEHVIRSATADQGPAVFVTQGEHRDRALVATWDRRRDLALLFVRRSYPTLPFAAAGVELRVGDPVVVIGTPYGLEASATTGVVSRIERDAIQTDAAANPGSSGGPLLDRDGEVVGVVSYRIRSSQGVNFAIPIQDVCRHLIDCG